jgi:hypothetical protein
MRRASRGEDHLGGAALGFGGPAGLTVLARAVDLHDALLAANFRAAATSSISASMSELRNSNDWLQVLQIR